MELTNLIKPMYMHEYGHTIDSRNFGITYLLAIGLPSVISAAGTGDHSIFWTELLANRNAEWYFSRQYNVKWNSCGSILVIDFQIYANKKVQILYQSKTEYKGRF